MPPLIHEFSLALPAPRERVFRALTDEVQLCCWFAEHAEVETRAGGDYRFWGVHTYGAPLRAQATQKILRIEPPRLLEFTWALEGCASEVAIELSEQGADETLLDGRHHFPDGLDVSRPLALVDGLWRTALANLSAHLADGGRAPIYRPDFSDPIPRLRQTVTLQASRDTVFKALLETIEADRQKILERVEYTKLVTDWPDDKAQRITWVLESVGERTRLILIHEPFERVTDLGDHPHRWARVLSDLKQRLEA